MSDPFMVLGVTDNATDDEIKQAYLDNVRRYPPERESARFQMVREAYEQIRNHRDRLHLRLFQPPVVSLDELVTQVLPADVTKRPEQAHFKALLLESLIAPRR